MCKIDFFWYFNCCESNKKLKDPFVKVESICLYVHIVDGFLCRGLLKDVPRHGVASAANAFYRRHYTGCVGNGMTS